VERLHSRDQLGCDFRDVRTECSTETFLLYHMHAHVCTPFLLLSLHWPALHAVGEVHLTYLLVPTMAIGWLSSCSAKLAKQNFRTLLASWRCVCGHEDRLRAGACGEWEQGIVHPLFSSFCLSKLHSTEMPRHLWLPPISSLLGKPWLLAALALPLIL